MTLRETCRSRPAHGDSWPGRRKTSPHPPAQRRTGQREAGAQVIEDSPDGGLAVGSKREGMWGSHGVVPYEVRQGAVSPVGCDSTTLAPAGGEQTASLGSRGIRPSCEQASSPADLGSRHKTTPAAGPHKILSARLERSRIPSARRPDRSHSGLQQSELLGCFAAPLAVETFMLRAVRCVTSRATTFGSRA